MVLMRWPLFTLWLALVSIPLRDAKKISGSKQTRHPSLEPSRPPKVSTTDDGDGVEDVDLVDTDEEESDENIVEEVSSEPYLFNLSQDYDETTNVYEDEEYESSIKFLTGRVDTWNENVKDPEIPTWDTDTYSAWDECGGVCSWTSNINGDDDGVVNSNNLSQIYSYDNAPHIVMIVVDDWGWNDFGSDSSYMSWTTPHIDKIKADGISFSNYFSHEMCVPSRGALMTGRYALRLGLWKINDVDAELPLSEGTLAEEFQRAGYKTYAVGKWHLGMSTANHLPTNRGFEHFYGYYGGYIDYWTKTYEVIGESAVDADQSLYVDLHEDDNLVTNSDELDSNLHTGYLFEQKAENYIALHAEKHSDKPMFLYYGLQLVHYPLQAPDEFLRRCQEPMDGDDTYNDEEYNYCGMNVMLDEVIANLTCSLSDNGLSENTIMIIMSDNGGEKTIKGNSYPFRGHKGSLYRGGLSCRAVLYSSNTELIPSHRRGSTYSGQMHVTDWLPTLMNLATNGEWISSNSMSGKEIDGVDMWEAIINNDESPRSEIVHFVDGTDFSIQYYINDSILKLNNGNDPPDVESPTFVFLEDKDPSASHVSCEAIYSNVVNGPNHFDPDVEDNVDIYIDSTDPETNDDLQISSSWTQYSLYFICILTILALFSVTIGVIRKAINRGVHSTRAQNGTCDTPLSDEAISLTKDNDDALKKRSAATNQDYLDYLRSLPESYQNSALWSRDDCTTDVILEETGI